MTDLEKALGETEVVAEAALKSATIVVKQARALTRAALTGNLASIRRNQERLDAALEELQNDVSRARSSWPYSEDDEKRYLQEAFGEQLVATARENGMSMHERDEDYISYPSILRILPADRAVRIDGKRVATIRPSFLVELLRKKRDKPIRFRPQPFLEALFTVYKGISSGASSRLKLGSSGPVIPLSEVFKMLTALPGHSREYGRNEFARDLFLLDSSGHRITRRGATVSFSASTGTRRNFFRFIGPEGQPVEYYGIRFTEAGA